MPGEHGLIRGFDEMRRRLEVEQERIADVQAEQFLAGCLGPVVGAIAAWALPKKALQT